MVGERVQQADRAASRSMLGNMPVLCEGAIFDMGDVQSEDHALESAQNRLAANVSTAIARGSLRVVLGGRSWSGVGNISGDYAVASGYSAVTDREPSTRILIYGWRNKPIQVRRFVRCKSWNAQYGKPFHYRVLGMSGVLPMLRRYLIALIVSVCVIGWMALVHVSHNSMRRSLHLEDEHFTGLTRFLSAPGNKGHGFGSLHIPFVALHAENVDLANPVSFDIQPVAGGIKKIPVPIMTTRPRRL